MKKIIAWLLVCLMLVAVCGCSKDDNNVVSNDNSGVAATDAVKDEGPAAGTELVTFYQAILDAQPEGVEELILFEESNPDLIASFYPGLDAITLNQQVFYMPPIATHPCEIVLVEAKNSDDAQAVAEIFEARIVLGSDDTSYPESAAGWAQFAQVQRSGNFVCMIVLPEAYVIPENVFAVN